MGPFRAGDQRFPRSRRLRRRRDFLRLQAEGRKFVGRWLVFLYAKGEGGPCRLGITVSRRVGGAVVRNRVKRLIREVFRQNQDLVQGVTDLVVIGRQSARRAGFSEIAEDFFRLAAKNQMSTKAGGRSSQG